MYYINEGKNTSILAKKCRIRSGVWFVGLSNNDLASMVLPASIDKKMVLTTEALADPLPFIKTIFSQERHGDIKTNLNDAEHKLLLERVLCPQVDIVPTATFKADLKKVVFHRMLKEQTMVLNFLTEQKFAAINGAAGTGKTLIAVEKAKRHALNGEKVLFLCFNSALRDYLKENNKDDNVDYYNIHKYACEECHTSEADFKKLKEKLEDYYLNGNFKYNQVIIDEGQDFGQPEIENNKIIEILYTIMESKENGSLFVFYDALQKIQSVKLPKVLKEADCKITLYKNCRNTKNIAETSLRPITDRAAKLCDDAIDGDPAKVFFCKSKSDEIKELNTLIENYQNDGFKDIVILSCKTESKSILADFVQNGKYKKCKFSTCRKFKGLEADIVILIDLDENTFEDESKDENENRMLFYVGTSRARVKLSIITSLNDDSCKQILIDKLNEKRKIKNAKRSLATKLNAVAVVLE